jgi:hypothetical protein
MCAMYGARTVTCQVVSHLVHIQQCDSCFLERGWFPFHNPHGSIHSLNYEFYTKFSAPYSRFYFSVLSRVWPTERVVRNSWVMKEECIRRPVLIAAKNVKSPSNLWRADLYTARNAIRSTGDHDRTSVSRLYRFHSIS